MSLSVICLLRSIVSYQSIYRQTLYLKTFDAYKSETRNQKLPNDIWDWIGVEWYIPATHQTEEIKNSYLPHILDLYSGGLVLSFMVNGSLSMKFVYFILSSMAVKGFTKIIAYEFYARGYEENNVMHYYRPFKFLKIKLYEVFFSISNWMKSMTHIINNLKSNLCPLTYSNYFNYFN